MTNIEDKAQGSPEVDLARQSAPGAYEFVSPELVSADQLTAEGEFPEYGDFLPVKRATANGSAEERHIECPEALAKWLVEEGIEEGDRFRIRSVQKIDGRWSYDVERAEEPPTDSADE